MSTTSNYTGTDANRQIASLDYTAEDAEDFLRALIEPQEHLLTYKKREPVTVKHDYWGKGTPAIRDAIAKVYTKVQADPEAMPDVLPELGQNAMPYLTTVARNMTLDQENAERIHTSHVKQAANDPTSAFFQEPVWDKQAQRWSYKGRTGLSAEAEYFRKQQEVENIERINRLPFKLREVALRRYEGMSTSEIAQSLSLHRNTVLKRLNKIKSEAIRRIIGMPAVPMPNAGWCAVDNLS